MDDHELNLAILDSEKDGNRLVFHLAIAFREITFENRKATLDGFPLFKTCYKVFISNPKDNLSKELKRDIYNFSKGAFALGQMSGRVCRIDLE